MGVLPGDDLILDAAVEMNRSTVLPATPEQLWPWLVQLGKQRAGWYLPSGVERFVPARRRAMRRLDPQLQSLEVGDHIPDWGPGEPTFRVELIETNQALVYSSLRDRSDGWRWPRGDAVSESVVALSWALVLTPVANHTRLDIRLRINRAGRLVRVGGGLIDLLTTMLLFAGLRERLR